MAPGSRLDELTAKYMQNPRRFFVPLANEYRKRGDRDRAIGLCREHLPGQPGHLSGYIVLGQSCYEKGDLAAAREVFLTAVALDDENLIALRLLGDIARAGGNPVEARQWYARVLDSDPHNDEIEHLLRELGDTALAGPGHPATAAAVVPVIAAEVAATLPDAASGGLPSFLDPTPPGLAAITNPVASPEPVAPPPVRDADAPPRPAVPTFERFDLSTLIAETEGLNEPLPAAPPDARAALEGPPPVEAPVPAGTELPFVVNASDLAGDAVDESVELPGLPALDVSPEPEQLRTAMVDAPAVDEAEPVAPFEEPDVASALSADDGAGFAYVDLDTFTAQAGSEAPAWPVEALPGLPPVEVSGADDLAPIEADAAPLLAEPEVPALSLPEPTLPIAREEPRADAAAAQEAARKPEDDVLTARPAFGVLASLASWRSSRGKPTPLEVSVEAPAEPVPAAAAPPSPPSSIVEPPPPRAPVVTPGRVFAAEAEDASGLDWDADPGVAAETPAEFMTETMAAIYVQQGFLDRALGIYRTLSARNPHDLQLAARVIETETAIEQKLAEAASEELDGNYLAGLNLDGLVSHEVAPVSSEIPGAIPVAPLELDRDQHIHLSSEYAAIAEEPAASADDSWFDEPAAPSVADAGDDWFADAADAVPGEDESEGSPAVYGAPLAGFAAAPSTPASSTPVEDRRKAHVVSLHSVFGVPLIAAPDEGASDMLFSLTEQMVGRLPKEAPTLPVPDVLELPSPASGDQSGATPAPLLSFDRFFAGTGSSPRIRMDTPAIAVPPVPEARASAPVSLSPTFGGLPVVPMSPATPAPGSDWTVLSTRSRTPIGNEIPPIAAEPSLPAPLPAWRTATPAPPAPAYPSFLADDPAPVSAGEHAEPVVSPPPAPQAPTPAAPSAPATPAPSDFHKWLEGLS